MLEATKKVAFEPFMTGRETDRFFSTRYRDGERTGPFIAAGEALGRMRSAVLGQWYAHVRRGTVDAFAGTVLRSLGVNGRERIDLRDPDTAVVTSRDSVMRIPFGKAAEARCRRNARVLAALETTPIAGFVPRPLDGGKVCGFSYYRESRLPFAVRGGTGKDAASLVRAAVEFMTAFHLQTARETVIDARRFHRLFARDLRRLDAFLGAAGKAKRELLERALRRRFLYAPCKTVWFHGDCTMENLLFDPSHRQVRGVTGWGAARRDGLPLLDVISLLAHAKSRSTRRPAGEVLRERCFTGGWDKTEGTLIDRYVSLLRLPREHIRPLLVMSWAHHIARHAGESPEEIERTIESALGVLGVFHGR